LDETPETGSDGPDRRADSASAAILKAIPHAVIAVHERTIVYTNNAVESVFGWHPEELMGQSAMLLYRTSGEFEEIEKRLMRILESKGSHSEEVVCRCKDGTDITCRASSAIVDYPGKRHVVTVYEDISAALLTYNMIRTSEEKYRGLFKNALEGMAEFTSDELLDVNPALSRMLGFGSPREMMESVGGMFEQLWVNAEERDRYKRLLGKDGFVRRFETQLYKKDGNKVWTLMSSRAIGDVQDRNTRYEITVFDITERRIAEEALRESEQKFRDISYSMADWIWELDERAVYTHCSEQVQEVLGYSPDEVIGKRPLDFIAPDDFDRVRSILLKIGNQRRPVRDLESWHVHKDGRRVCVLTSGVPVFGKDGTFLGYRGVDKDITDRKLLEERLQFLSFRDDLTGLYNRRGFLNLAEQQLRIAYRQKKRMLLIFADVDGMKTINDNFGHREGDKALVEVAEIFKHVFREADIAGRIGGDEFAVLIIDATLLTAEVLPTRLRKSVVAANKDGTKGYAISLSVGVAEYDPEHPSSLDELMSEADVLMYAEKRGSL
jgi:diguanylate cyclase (GGDEF)-like protein/PAS domain S-box-containing protein